jgi:hypothetical protein
MVSWSTDFGLTSGCPGGRATCPAGRSPPLEGPLMGGNAGLRCMVGVDAPSVRGSLDCTAGPPICGPGGPLLL